jgi:hypothetical protein
MARYSKGKNAYLIDDRTGRKIKYKDAKTEWTGARVSKAEWEGKHPQLTPRRLTAEAQTLYDSRSDNDEVNATVNYRGYGGDWTKDSLEDNSLRGVSTRVELGVGYTITLGAEATTNVATMSLGTPTLAFPINKPNASTNVATMSLGSVIGKLDPEVSGIAATMSLGTVSLSLDSGVWGRETWGANTWGD